MVLRRFWWGASRPPPPARGSPWGRSTCSSLLRLSRVPGTTCQHTAPTQIPLSGFAFGENPGTQPLWARLWGSGAQPGFSRSRGSCRPPNPGLGHVESREHRARRGLTSPPSSAPALQRPTGSGRGARGGGHSSRRCGRRGRRPWNRGVSTLGSPQHGPPSDVRQKLS